MQLSELHQHTKDSVSIFSNNSRTEGFRALIESGSAEVFLTSLLYIQLQSAGFTAVREYPIKGRVSVDISVHAPIRLNIEAKQLHLKGDGKHISNLVKDLSRQSEVNTLGVIYVADERTSTTALHFQRFRGTNRRAKTNVMELLAALPKHFNAYFPDSIEQAMVYSSGLQGGIKLYAFVVSSPVVLNLIT